MKQNEQKPWEISKTSFPHTPLYRPGRREGKCKHELFCKVCETRQMYRKGGSVNSASSAIWDVVMAFYHIKDRIKLRTTEPWRMPFRLVLDTEIPQTGGWWHRKSASCHGSRGRTSSMRIAFSCKIHPVVSYSCNVRCTYQPRKRSEKRGVNCFLILLYILNLKSILLRE
jgi:hypothetical protein